PISSVMNCAKARAVRSALPPTPKPTTKVMGRSGQASACARACVGTVMAAAADSKSAIPARRVRAGFHLVIEFSSSASLTRSCESLSTLLIFCHGNLSVNIEGFLYLLGKTYLVDETFLSWLQSTEQKC